MRAAITVDLRGVRGADLDLIDALARLQLNAGRHGGRVCVRNAPPELLDLLELAGLRGVLDCEPSLRGGSGVEVRRQAEEREQALGVEEEGDPRDPVSGGLDDLQ